MTSRPLRVLLALAPLVLLTGCASGVQPWQRGVLARPDMAMAPSPALAGLREHVHTSKEAAQGGYGGSGGGCGCN